MSYAKAWLENEKDKRKHDLICTLMAFGLVLIFITALIVCLK